MRYRYLLADVFTDRLFGGNSLAVFPEGAGLEAAVMQAVARELNLSETVFVLPPDDPAHVCRLRIFTPAKELPFAGHPTVGTAFLLAHDGRLALDGELTQLVFEEGVGPVPVSVRVHDGKPVFTQLSAARLPERGALSLSRAALAALVGLQVEDLLDGDWTPELWSCGIPFLFVPLRDTDAVRRAQPDLGRWPDTLAGCLAQEVYVFARDPAAEGIDIHARMFAPGLGIVEDPATGSAAAALAGYLAQRETAGSSVLHWSVEQGMEMGRPSRIEIEADRCDGALTAVRVGGASMFVGEGVLELPTQPA